MPIFRRTREVWGGAARAFGWLTDRLYGRETDDSLGLEVAADATVARPVAAIAAANMAKLAALAAGRTVVLRPGTFPIAAGTIACLVRAELGAIIEPTGAVIINQWRAGLYACISYALGGTLTFAAGACRRVEVAWFGAAGDRAADDAAAFRRAGAAAANIGVVGLLSGLRYRIGSAVTFAFGVTLEGQGAPASIAAGAAQAFPQCVRDFAGDLFTWDGSGGPGVGTGCGVQKVALVSGAGVAGTANGRALRFLGSTQDLRPNFVRVEDFTIERESVAVAEWDIPIDVDGEAVPVAGDGVRSVYISRGRVVADAVATAGIRLASVFNAWITDVNHSLMAPVSILVTGKAGQESSNINISGCSGVKVKCDFAQTVRMIGGAWSEIQTTANTLAGCVFMPCSVTTWTNGAAGNAALFAWDGAEFLADGNVRISQAHYLQLATGAGAVNALSESGGRVLLDVGAAGIATGGPMVVGSDAPANATATFQVASVGKGFLLPQLTTAQRDALVAPPDGLELYNTTLGKKQLREAGAWKTFTTA